MEEFKTIKENISGQIVEKKSKFIANIFYIDSIEEAEEIIKNTKKKYYDAKHNCYAYIVIDKDGNIIERCSDDGEPSGTAGQPILSILKGNNLCNIVVIVTRYFGGILLGTGGLVRAYSGVVMNALEKANLVEEIMGTQLTIEIEYASLDKFIYFCRKNEIYIEKIEYQETVFCTIVVKEEEQISLITNREENSLSILKCEILGKKILRNTIKEK